MSKSLDIVSFNSRMPSASSVIARLLDVVQVDHPENPWADSPKLLEALNVAKQAWNQGEEKRIETLLAGKLAIRVRNRLIVHLLSHLGMRLGELLELKVSDLQGASMFILLQPDVPDDPRKYAPSRMTRARKLPTYPGLQVQWFDYALIRGKLPGALKHPFLLVNQRDGSPLSSRAVTRIFSELRQVEGLPSNLTPYHLRRTWKAEICRLAEAGADATAHVFGRVGVEKGECEPKRFEPFPKLLDAHD